MLDVHWFSGLMLCIFRLCHFVCDSPDVYICFISRLPQQFGYFIEHPYFYTMRGGKRNTKILIKVSIKNESQLLQTITIITNDFTNNRKRYMRKRNKRYEGKGNKNTLSKSEAEIKVTCPVPLKTYNFRVKLFQSRCQIRKTNRTMAKISKFHILESKNTGQDICHKILNTDIGLNRNINLDGVIPVLSPILELFKNRHNRFNYFDKLKCIIAENSRKYPIQKFKHQIHVRLLQYFFNLLVYKNVPSELFGTSRNRKAIKNTISCLLKTVPDKISITRAFKRTVRIADANGALLDIKSLFKKLDISRINWLHSIDNDTVRWIVILKLLHWFFTQYIIKILHKYVVLKVCKKQWVYITKDNWCNMQEEFIKEKENTLSLVPYTKLNKKRNIGIYKFIPGASGLRAVFLARYNIKEKYDEIDIVLKFLQQLYVTYFNENGIPTVTNCKHAILNFIKLKSKSRNQLYFVRCDIQDAFGSIIQEKLYDIICTCCKQLENYVAIRTCTLSKPKRKQNRMKKNTVQVLSSHLKRTISKNIIPSKEKPKLIKKKWFTNKIYKLIFQQKVKLNGRIYSIKLGVPQGAPVSSILSDIYYQHMIKEIFSEYADNGLLSTYVDDILYITENEHYAVKFLNIIKNGIPEYNVRFNPTKIQSNIEMPHTSAIIEFLGWKILLNQIR